MLKLRIFCFFLLLLLLAGCAGQHSPQTPPTPWVVLQGTQWYLVQIQSMDDQVYKPVAGEQYTLAFNADGSVALRVSCNRARGSWQRQGNSGLTFGKMAVTRAMCHPMTLHARFLRDLDEVRSFVMRKGHLYLATRADGAILEFAPLAQPAFDCNLATGAAQLLVCQSPGLAALDVKLHRLYEHALQTWPAAKVARLKATQRGWIKGRDDCWKARNLEDCVRDEYARRITALQIGTGEAKALPPVHYQCDNGAALTADFYNGTQIPSLMLHGTKDEWLLMRAISASGARYLGQNVMFWDKGGHAMFQPFDAPMVHCQVPADH